MDLNDKKIEHILYMRDLDENENFLSINHDNPNAKYWAEIYNGNQGFIIHGHQVFSEVTRFKNSIAIDTGCVYGNKLSAIYIKDTNKPWEYEVFSVNAKKEYEKYYKKF
jgi:diadenosine tetraphosphatase ApaH/serine/threonine PP2A family protein phosphatase